MPIQVRYFEAFWHEIKAREDEEDDQRFFVVVMELLEISLDKKIGPPLPPPPVTSTAQWMRQVASGVAYIHSLNLQHRDLKPGNVMLDHAGHAKIIDFGLACISYGSVASQSRTRAQAPGTDAYMSPEKAGGKRYGPADDVWAIGCIMAELLLGRPIGHVAKDDQKLKRTITESKVAHAQMGSWVEGSLQHDSKRRPTAKRLEEGLTVDVCVT